MDNNKSKSMLLPVVIFLALAFSLLLFFYFRDKNQQASPGGITNLTDEMGKVEESGTDEGPQKGDIGYREPVRTVKIGTSGVTRAAFEKVEAGSIFINENGDSISYQMPSDEVAVLCTPQDLTSATEVDYDQVSKVTVVAPGSVAELIQPDTAIVVFAQADNSGVTRAHTIAMGEDACSL